jgi:hypothetical protein
VGKASRHKSQRRRGIGPSRADFEKRRGHQMLLTGMQTMIDKFEAEKEREQQARRAWAGGAEPPRATRARWREDSVGDRFFAGDAIADAVGAPRLSDAALPSPQQMAENSGHRATAVSALVRAVVLEGAPVDDPAVTRVLDLLAPVVRDELAAAAGEDRDFPDTHGPLFLLGACVLTDATWAIVGLDPLDQSLALMEPQIDEALAEAERAGLPDGKVIAEELIRAFAVRQSARRADPGQGCRAGGRPASRAHHAGRACGPGADRRRLGCRAIGRHRRLRGVGHRGPEHRRQLLR